MEPAYHQEFHYARNKFAGYLYSRTHATRGIEKQEGHGQPR